MFKYLVVLVLALVASMAKGRMTTFVVDDFVNPYTLQFYSYEHEIFLNGATIQSANQFAAGGKIMFAILDFTDAKASESVSKTDLNEMFFGASDKSFNNFIKKASYGNVSFTGGMSHIYGPIEIDQAVHCSFGGIIAQADAILKQMGVDLSQYQHRSYIAKTRCRWAGIAQVGGGLSIIQSNYALRPFIYSHELGHNFGMHHSNKPGRSYADWSCPMGNSFRQTNYNGPQALHRMGWLHKFDNIVLQEPDDGIYEIKTLSEDMANGMPAIIRLPKDIDEYYFVSLRRKVNLDAEFLRDEYVGVNIHQMRKSGLASPEFLKSLQLDGDVWSENGISVKVMGMIGKTAKVMISRSPGDDDDDDDDDDDGSCPTDKLSLRFKSGRVRILRRLHEQRSFRLIVSNMNKRCRTRVRITQKKATYRFVEHSYSDNDFDLQGGESKEIVMTVKYIEKSSRRTLVMRNRLNGQLRGKNYRVRLR